MRKWGRKGERGGGGVIGVRAARYYYGTFILNVNRNILELLLIPNELGRKNLDGNPLSLLSSQLYPLSWVPFLLGFY